MPTELKSAPANACRFRASELKFAEALPAVDGRPAAVPVSIFARSGEGVPHWYWRGLVYHDMAGFSPQKDTVPLDYRHDDDEIVGHADKFDAGDAGLTVGGLLIPFKAEDRAAEIIFRRKQGTPYEASIYFDLKSVEELFDGATAQVNGQTVTGPATIFREWSLLAVAICPHGHETVTVVNDAEPGSDGELSRVPNRTVQFSSYSKEPIMSAAAPAAASVPNTTAAAEQLAAPPANQFAAAQAALQKFVARFGAEAGATHFVKGTTYEAALELEFDALKTNHATQLAAETAKTAALQTKLSLVDRGETEPAQFQDGSAPAAGQPAGKFAHMGAIGRFAASINLPGGKK